LHFTEMAQKRSTILKDLNLKPKGYLLATIHRPYNTDSPRVLQEILSAFQTLDEPVIFPVHPRTQAKIQALGFDLHPQASTLQLIPPVGYLDMLMLEKNARMILTDSGGMQKEAYFFGAPCVTLRPETEWVETVEAGWNVLTGANRQEILQVVSAFQPPVSRPPLYGNGNAAKAIIDRINRTFHRR
jgi:UDP-GlcNAc3NAcA epimerase